MLEHIMFTDFFEDLETKMQRQEKALAEVLISNENLDLEVEAYFSGYNVTPGQLSQFISNKEHFSEENWDALQERKKQLDEKLQRDLENIANPLKLKKAYKQRKVETHWLFVR